jgi:hypothetical protein
MVVTVAILLIVKAVSGAAVATSANHIVPALVKDTVMAMAAAYIVVTTPTSPVVVTASAAIGTSVKIAIAGANAYHIATPAIVKLVTATAAAQSAAATLPRSAATALAMTPLLGPAVKASQLPVGARMYKNAARQANAVTWITAKGAILKAEPAMTCAKDAKSVSEATAFPVSF